MTSDEIIYDYAMTMVGTPYVWGGDDPHGWDCSGLVQELLKASGIRLERDYTAQGLFDLFKDKSSTEKKFGSLAFYGGSRESISHVAFLLSDSLCIEAGGGGRNIQTVEDAIKWNAFVRIRPVTHRSDLRWILYPRLSGAS